MRQYGLTPAFFKQMRLHTLRTSLFILPVLIGVFLIFSGESILDSLIFFLPIALLLFGAALYTSLQQQQRAWESYCLTLDGETIRLNRKGSAEVTIAHQQISKIVEAPWYGLTVLAANPTRYIGIPLTVENYAEVRSLLEQWRPIEPAPAKANLWRYLVPLGTFLLVAGLFVGFMLAKNAILVILLGSILATSMLANLVLIQKSSAAPKETKRQAWIILLPLLYVLMKLALTFIMMKQ